MASGSPVHQLKLVANRVSAEADRWATRLDYFPDGLHPDARGHRVIADLLVERLARSIGRQEK